MAVKILQRANPNLNIEVHTTVFYAEGVERGHGNLLEAVVDNLDKQIIVLATDSTWFGKNAEYVKALVALLNSIHPDARLMPLRQW